MVSRFIRCICRTSTRFLSSCSSRSPRLLFIGDSLSTGCYPAFLVRRLRQSGLAVTAHIRAKAGATSDDAAQSIGRLVQAERAAEHGKLLRCVVGALVLVGGNDLKRERSFDRSHFERTIAAMLKTALQLFPDAVVCVGTYPVPGHHPHLRDDSAELVREAINPALRDAAHDAGASVCDLQDLFAGREELRSDGLHPTVAGDKLLADAWFETVFPLLKIQRETAKPLRG